MVGVKNHSFCFIIVSKEAPICSSLSPQMAAPERVYLYLLFRKTTSPHSSSTSSVLSYHSLVSKGYFGQTKTKVVRLRTDCIFSCQEMTLVTVFCVGQIAVFSAVGK